MPLVGFIGRLTEQKGVDLILSAVPALLSPPPPPVPLALGDHLSSAAARLTVSSGSSSCSENLFLGTGEVLQRCLTQPCTFAFMQQAWYDTAQKSCELQPAPEREHGADAEHAVTRSLLRVTDEARDGRPQPMQLVLLGTGDAWMEAALRGLAMSYPGWAVGVAEFQVSVRVCALWVR